MCVCARCLIASGSSVWVFSLSENLRILDIKYQNGLVCVCVCVCARCLIASGSSVWVFSVSENLRILDIKYQNVCVCSSSVSC